MKNQLQHIKIKNFTTELGAAVLELNLSYQVFGKELGTAPIQLIAGEKIRKSTKNNYKKCK
jgi:aspartokinase/homoserine dehydrogenase 1